MIGLSTKYRTYQRQSRRDDSIGRQSFAHNSAVEGSKMYRADLAGLDSRPSLFAGQFIPGRLIIWCDFSNLVCPFGTKGRWWLAAFLCGWFFSLSLAVDQLVPAAARPSAGVQLSSDIGKTKSVVTQRISVLKWPCHSLELSNTLGTVQNLFRACWRESVGPPIRSFESEILSHATYPIYWTLVWQRFLPWRNKAADMQMTLLMRNISRKPHRRRAVSLRLSKLGPRKFWLGKHDSRGWESCAGCVFWCLFDFRCYSEGSIGQEYVLASSEKLTSPQVVGYDFNKGQRRNVNLRQSWRDMVRVEPFKVGEHPVFTGGRTRSK